MPEPPSSAGVQDVQGGAPTQKSLKQRYVGGVQGVQGGAPTQKSLKQRHVGGVQGVQGGSPIDPDKEKTSVAVLEKNAAENVGGVETPLSTPVQLPVTSDQLPVNQLAVNQLAINQLAVDSNSDNQASSVTSYQSPVTSETPSDFEVPQTELVDLTKNLVTGNCSLVTDYSSYPHLTSNDPRACRNRATECKQKMLACADSDELVAFRAEGGFSRKEIDWVWFNLLTPGEKDKVLSARAQKQLSLFDSSSTHSTLGREQTPDRVTECVEVFKKIVAVADYEQKSQKDALEENALAIRLLEWTCQKYADTCDQAWKLLESETQRIIIQLCESSDSGDRSIFWWPTSSLEDRDSGIPGDRALDNSKYKPVESDLFGSSVNNAPFEFDEIISEIDTHMNNLGWSIEDGRNYLLTTYGKKSRALLSDEELLEFLAHVKSKSTADFSNAGRF